MTVFVWFAPTARSNVPEDVTRFESDATPEEILERVPLGMQQGIQQMQHLAEALEIFHWTRPRQGQDIVISKDDQDLEDLHLFAVFFSCDLHGDQPQIKQIVLLQNLMLLSNLLDFYPTKLSAGRLSASLKPLTLPLFCCWLNCELFAIRLSGDSNPWQDHWTVSSVSSTDPGGRSENSSIPLVPIFLPHLRLWLEAFQ